MHFTIACSEVHYSVFNYRKPEKLSNKGKACFINYFISINLLLIKYINFHCNSNEWFLYEQQWAKMGKIVVNKSIPVKKIKNIIQKKHLDIIFHVHFL